MANFFPLNLAGLIPMGVALYVAIRIVYDRRLESTHDVMRTLLQIMAGVLILFGFGATATAFLGLAILVAVPFIIAFAIDSIWSYFSLERQAVLEYLAVAVEKRIPLATAARAYAIERGDFLGWRSLRLAEWLERGSSLSAALRNSGHSYGIGPSLAIGLGDELGCLPRTLQETTACELAMHRSNRGWEDIAAYLTIVSFLGSAICSFYVIKIAPVVTKMQSEFALQTPPPFFFVPSADVFPILGILLPPVAILVLATMVVSSNSNRWPRFLPVLRTLDRAWVMRALSWGLEAQYSVPQILACIARHMPGGTHWERIMAANARIAAGVPWIDALRDARALTELDATLLAAAERAGNLPWVCRQRAVSYQQAYTRRLRWVTTLTFPIFIVILGYCVFVFSLQIFAALAHLVEGLS